MATLEKYVLRDGNPMPTLWQRIGSAWNAAKRSITLGPFNPKDPAIARYFGGGTVSAGVRVNEESAFAVSAFASAKSPASVNVTVKPSPRTRASAAPTAGDGPCDGACAERTAATSRWSFGRRPVPLFVSHTRSAG